MRGRNNNNNNNNNRKAPNPLQRSYESNGPDVKVRGTAQNVAEKYLQLARDAQSSGDTVAAESYFQHAEHYYRVLLAAQEQMAQQYGHSFAPVRGFGDDDEQEEGGEDEAQGFAPQGQGQNGQPHQPGLNGYGNGGPRQDDGGQPRQDGEGGQRFDRPRYDRQNQGQGGQGGQPYQDRGDRNNNRRFDRQDGGQRQDNRQDGGNRFEGRQDGRQDGRQENRGERRFDRNDGGRPDYQPRGDQPVVEGGEQPQQVSGERREPRGPRPERGERRPRREFEPRQADEAVDEGPAGLPSFLTNPVRQPIAVADPQPEPEPAPQAEAAAPAEAPEGDAGEAVPARKRATRRRSPREVMQALGADSDNPAEAE